MKYIGFDRALPNPQILNGISYDAVYLVGTETDTVENLSLIFGTVESYPPVDHDITVTLAHGNENWVFTPEAGYSELQIHNYQGAIGGTWVISVEDKSSSPGLWVEWGLKGVKQSMIVPEPSSLTIFMVGVILCLLKQK